MIQLLSYNRIMNFSSKHFVLCAVLVLCVFSGLVGVYAYKLHVQGQSQNGNIQVYAIMVTGKTNERMRFARMAIQNFKDQTYPNKKLIILNHHPSHVLVHAPDPNILEVRIDKTPMLTLGGLRNMALNMVPIDALWTPWDDDDLRAPHFLAYLVKHLRHEDYAVSFANRLEVNLTNGFVWGVTLRGQGTVHILSRAYDRRINYLDKDTMEDVNLYKDITRYGHTIRVITDNDPALYVRTVHGDNTSLYVDKDKSVVKYTFEWPATPQQRKTVQEIVSLYSNGADSRNV